MCGGGAASELEVLEFEPLIRKKGTTVSTATGRLVQGLPLPADTDPHGLACQQKRRQANNSCFTSLMPFKSVSNRQKPIRFQNMSWKRVWERKYGV